MKPLIRFVLDCCTFFCLLLWVAPLLAVVLDALCWFFTDSRCLRFEWTNARCIFAILWTCVAWVILVPLASAFGSWADDYK